MSTSTAEIMSKGMKCLTEQLGIIDAERFVSTPEEISAEAAQYEKEHPFTGNGVRL